MFKVGDKVRANLANRNYLPLPLRYIITVKRIEFEDDGTEMIIFDHGGQECGGYFAWRFELVEESTPMSKEQLIIQKIKELNERYANRRVSV